MKLLRAVLGVALGLSTVEGCSQTTYYAVVNPERPPDEGKCLEACQPVRSGGTKGYLDCVRTCPGARVFEEERCATVTFNRDRFTCRTEVNQAISALEIIAGIIVGVLVFGLIGFLAA